MMHDPQAERPTEDEVVAPLPRVLFRTVAVIRAAELRLQRHVTEQGFGGFWHPGLGQEGLQAGAVTALRSDDYLFYAHRGLGYAVAKGVPLEALFGDLLGRTTGTTKGKGGGTVHFVWPELGVLGQGGTLGSNFPLAAGAAISARMLGTDRVAAAFFGDGASARGTFHEAAIQASVWKLPVIWICENNGWALSARFGDQSPTENVADRAAAYGMEGEVIDGQDALAVHAAVSAAVERAREGAGPTLIEAKTVRLRGHYEGDQQPYRSEADPDRDQPRDPLDVLRPHLGEQEAAEIEAEAATLVERAFSRALEAPPAGEEVIMRDVWA